MRRRHRRGVPWRKSCEGIALGGLPMMHTKSPTTTNASRTWEGFQAGAGRAFIASSESLLEKLS